MECGRAAEILLVEDNEGDVLIARGTIEETELDTNVHVARDGVEAMAFLRRRGPYADAPRPDFILLDLNLPRLNGREVLELVKGDEELRSIPVVVLSSSAAESDIRQSYALNANCYITKPTSIDQYVEMMDRIEHFWLETVQLPPH